MTTLYRKHANSVGTWSISSDGPIIRILHASVMGGSHVEHTEHVKVNMSGRSLEDQVNLRIRSRISRMLDKGYKTTYDEAIKSSSNQLGLDRPMLAHPIERASSVNYKSSVLQKKLDGHRCLITMTESGIVAYSRQGKPITAIKHILEPLSNVLPVGVTLDGELYCHGYLLQTLASWIKREQPATANLNFVCYDLISDDGYLDRHAEASEIVSAAGNPKILMLGFNHYESEEATRQLFNRVRAAGFEGLMLRNTLAPYQSGKRSYDLLKIKEFHDEEFLVVDINPSSTGFAVCTCVTSNGSQFGVSAPGSISEKTEVLNSKQEYIGRKLRVQYSHITADGVPFHPSALNWHEEL